MWGPYGQFCKLCGVCTSDSSADPKPEQAKEGREFETLAKKAQEELENMSPEERAAWEKELEETISKDLKEQLRPYREPKWRWK